MDGIKKCSIWSGDPLGDLDVLERKPGALAGSTPLDQWRRAGKWPASYDRLWEALMERQGKQAGTKAMIALVQLGRQHGHAALRTAIETALAAGCHDVAAVRQLLAGDALRHPVPEPMEQAALLAVVATVAAGPLGHFDRPLPDVLSYDQLLDDRAAPVMGASVASVVGAAVAGGAQ
jgi:hypothetical protein